MHRFVVYASYCLCFFSCLARCWFWRCSRHWPLETRCVSARVWSSQLSVTAARASSQHTSQPTDYIYAQRRCDNWVLQLCTARYVFKMKAMRIRVNMDWCTSSNWFSWELYLNVGEPPVRDGLKYRVYSRSFCIEAQCTRLTAVPNILSAPFVLNMTEDTMTAVRGNLSGASGQKDSGQTETTNGAIPSFSPAELSEDSPSCTSELTRTWLQFAKTFVIIFPIYVLGYFEFSFSWLLIALTIFFFWKRNTKCKNTRLTRALSIFEQEDTVKQELEATELPSWVS